MEIIVLQVFVSLLLVASSLLLFRFAHAQRDHEHADRLALLPLDDDAGPRRRLPARAACGGPAPTSPCNPSNENR